MSLLDPALTRTLEQDRQRLSTTELPIITVAGTFHEEVRSFYGLTENELAPDIVLSRAHFSMALAVAMEVWGSHMQPQKAWLADPTNYVKPEKWQNIQFTEAVGKTIARQPLLKAVKDFIDRFGRNKLPILDSITPPLLYLTENIQRPILCFHIAAGNILVSHGKHVIQVITDPHVRPEYVRHADNPHMRFCVFDEQTKLQFLELVAIEHKAVDPRHIIVTGPPVDQRIVRTRKHKIAWRSGVLRLCITTGGLGTNKTEIRQILQELLPELHQKPTSLQLLVYAGTQEDIAEMVEELAEEHQLPISALSQDQAPLRIIYHPHILEANELLIQYGFPWAHGFITKPSGDMAYDAVAAGCFLLTLKEWGVWEERIREIFEQKDIAVRAQASHIAEQLSVLRSARTGSSWIERAMNHSLKIEKLFLLGTKKIVQTAQEYHRNN